MSLKAVATFRTTHDAIAAESMAQSKGVKGRLIPLPTQISAGCGLAFMMLPEEKDNFLSAIDGEVEIQGMHE
ncbi:MAG: DUF3343 domain-containing protein, partial [Lachnospiraceae bacterium]|nr:DUF3343 domain-containing protein [Candidatus Equihabitans merdae]